MSDISDISVIDSSGELIRAVGQVGLWLQTIGIIIILWLVFQVIFYYMNRKRMEEVYKIKKDVRRIEGKIDRILEKAGRK